MCQNQSNNSENEFLMELTEKTKADVKVRILFQYKSVDITSLNVMFGYYYVLTFFIVL